MHNTTNSQKHNESATTGCASHVLKSEAAGSLIAPWWLTAVQVINPALSIANECDLSKINYNNYTSIKFSEIWFWSFKVVVITLIYVQLFVFVISLILASDLLQFITVNPRPVQVVASVLQCSSRARSSPEEK